tara:strand:- start:526 stop:891 length:366 start_codon:yes stop_codon:yes gene_type:complete
MFINFNDISTTNGYVQTKKGLELRGGITPIRIIATLIKLKILSCFNKGYKPFRYQGDKNKIQEKGWFVRKGNGGKSGEACVRFNFGSKFSTFHAYNRNGKPRVSQVAYVPFKTNLMQTKVS